MHTNATTSARKATSSAPNNTYSFQKLRDQLAPEKKDIADELDAVSHDLEARGAKATAARLRRLDDYATVLPPESLPGLLDSNAALDELEEVTSAKYYYPWLVPARNLLALVPLLITWLSLSWATNAYQAEVNQHPNLVYQPFLILWENGFDHRMGLTFSTVAGIDTFLFFVIIGITVGIHWLERKSQVDARQLVTRMDQSVIQLVTALGQSRLAFSGNPSDWAAAVHRVIAAAMKETHQLAQAGQSVIQAADAATKAAADAVKASHIGVDEIAEQTRDYIRQVKGEFAETVEQFRMADKQFFAQLMQETNERLALAFAETTKQMREQSATHAQQMQEQFDTTTRRMSDEFTQLIQASRDALAQINAENRQFLADTNRESLATLSEAAKQAGRISEGLRASAESLQEAIAQHKGGAEALVDSMAKIGEVTQRFGDNMQTFTSTTASMDRHVQEVAQAHERFTQRAETMATTLASAAGETKAASVGVQATTAQMADALSQATVMSGEVVRATRLLVQTQVDLPHITQAMRDAADNLRNLHVTVDMSQAPIIGRLFRKKVA